MQLSGDGPFRPFAGQVPVTTTSGGAEYGECTTPPHAWASPRHPATSPPRHLTASPPHHPFIPSPCRPGAPGHCPGFGSVSRSPLSRTP